MSVFAWLSIGGASLGVGNLAIVITWLILRKSPFSVKTVDKAVIAWLIYDAVTHWILVRII